MQEQSKMTTIEAIGAKSLFIPMLILCLLGVVFILSASQGTTIREGFLTAAAKKQLFFVISGIAIYQLGFKIAQTQIIFKIKLLWILAVFLLCLPLSPLGKSINGASRWISLVPGLSLQLSEFVKVLWVLILANFSYNHHFAVQKRLKETSVFCLALAFILMLILAQPDFGSSLVLAMITLMTLYVAKVRFDLIIALCTCIGAIAVYLITQAPYRLKRLLAFLDPQAYAQAEAYQLWQSLIAVSSGGSWGQGLGESWQKYQALPECHTDFIFSIVIEEVGFYGGLLFLILYFSWIGLLLFLAVELSLQQKYLAAYVFVGAGSLFLVQLFVNLGVCLGILPTKGLTLPFMSYGGSSLWAFMLLVGLLDGVKYRD